MSHQTWNENAADASLFFTFHTIAAHRLDRLSKFETQYNPASKSIPCVFLSLEVSIPSSVHLPLLPVPQQHPPPTTGRFHHTIMELHRPNTTVTINKVDYLLRRHENIQHTLNYQVNIKWSTKCAANLQRRSWCPMQGNGIRSMRFLLRRWTNWWVLKFLSHINCFVECIRISHIWCLSMHKNRLN